MGKAKLDGKHEEKSLKNPPKQQHQSYFVNMTKLKIQG